MLRQAAEDWQTQGCSDLRGGEPLPIAKQLRADHAALVSLLVPTPSGALIATLRALLAEHNPLEEGPQGVYALCDALAGAAGEVEPLLRRLRAAPEVPLAPHFDGPAAHARIASLLAARKRVGRSATSPDTPCMDADEPKT